MAPLNSLHFGSLSGGAKERGVALKSLFAIVLALLITNQPAGASTINASYGPPANFDVNYSVSGSSGNWLIDLSVTNNMSANTGIYFFDVLLPSTDIVSSPPNWAYAPGDNPWGMPDGVNYNNPWCVNACGNFNNNLAILGGQTLGGFEAIDTDLIAPSSLQFLAFDASPGACCGEYEGTAFAPVSPTPLPASFPLFATGLGAVGLLGWRKKRRAPVGRVAT